MVGVGREAASGQAPWTTRGKAGQAPATLTPPPPPHCPALPVVTGDSQGSRFERGSVLRVQHCQSHPGIGVRVKLVSADHVEGGTSGVGSEHPRWSTLPIVPLASVLTSPYVVDAVTSYELPATVSTLLKE